VSGVGEQIAQRLRVAADERVKIAAGAIQVPPRDRAIGRDKEFDDFRRKTGLCQDLLVQHATYHPPLHA
jgi:hypothetical protein